MNFFATYPLRDFAPSFFSPRILTDVLTALEHLLNNSQAKRVVVHDKDPKPRRERRGRRGGRHVVAYTLTSNLRTLNFFNLFFSLAAALRFLFKIVFFSFFPSECGGLRRNKSRVIIFFPGRNKLRKPKNPEPTR